MKRRITALLIGLLVLLGLLYPFVEPYLLRVNEIDIVDEDIPAGFDGKKIVFASDIHCGPLFSVERVRGLVELINGLEPDIILLGGDYTYSKNNDVGHIEPCISEFRGLQATFGVYGVLGNHDHWSDADMTWQAMKDAGVIALDNNARWITIGDDRIKIGGVGDLWENVQDIQPTVGDTSEDNFVILVSHNPEFAEEFKTRKIDLMLSGHTHGGQVTFFGLWAPVRTIRDEKYLSGVIETEHTKLIVTKGVGMTGLPIRFFAPPEVIQLNLHKKSRT